jgi:hypothetical protein
MRKTIFLATLFILFIAPILKAQTGVYPLNAQAEGAAEFNTDMLNTDQTFGGILSQDNFTGSADISIPFYKYSVGGLDLGVGMTYQTVPIAVDRVPSAIGIGWELYAGATITRQTRGFEDDMPTADVDFKTFWSSYWFDWRHLLNVDYNKYNAWLNAYV